MRELEAVVYETRRVLAAFIGSPDAPPAVVPPLLAGMAVGLLVVGAHVARVWR